MTAVAFRSFFIRSAIPSRTALAMLVRRALLASKKISSRVDRGVGAGGPERSRPRSSVPRSGASGGAGPARRPEAAAGAATPRTSAPTIPPIGEGEKACLKSMSTLAVQSGRDGEPRPAEEESHPGREHRVVLFRVIASVQ